MTSTATLRPAKPAHALRARRAHGGPAAVLLLASPTGPDCPPAQYHPRPAAASSGAYPLPAGPGRASTFPSRPTPTSRARASAASSATRGRIDPHKQADRQARMHRLPRRRRDRLGSSQFAHVSPRYPEAWRTSGNPVRSYTLLNHESPEFTRFVNPGDLRVAHISCGDLGLPPRRGRQQPQEHDDPRGHALGRGPVQQRGLPARSGPATARATA